MITMIKMIIHTISRCHCYLLPIPIVFILNWNNIYDHCEAFPPPSPLEIDSVRR